MIKKIVLVTLISWCLSSGLIYSVQESSFEQLRLLEEEERQEQESNEFIEIIKQLEQLCREKSSPKSKGNMAFIKEHLKEFEKLYKNKDEKLIELFEQA